MNCRVQIEGKDCSPLIAAVKANSPEIAHQLVMKGADINGKALVETYTERLEYTALFAATQAGNTSIMYRLLELGADINEVSIRQTDSSRYALTPLAEAARLKMTEAFKLLLFWDTSYSSGLKQAIMIDKTDSRTSAAYQTLLDSVRKGTQANLAQVIKNGAGVNALSFEGTPLSVAASCSQSHKVRLLLDQGADVHLASLFLSRSGQQKTANLLVKTVYGSTPASQTNVRTSFIRHYYKVVNMCQSSRSNQLKEFKTHYQNYRQAWSSGIRVMDQICGGTAPEGPDRLLETLAFLTVSRAVTETSAGDAGDIYLIDKFDSDLPRWQMIFTEDGDLAQYREAVLSLWGVNLSQKYFLDLDYDDAETLGRFKGIISRLIEGARGPLDLDSFSPNNFQESFERWRQHRREPAMPVSHSIPIGIPSPCELASKAGGLPPPLQRSEGARTVACQPKMDREEILQATAWLYPKQDKSAAVYFFDVTGVVAKDLIRGVIFSIVFVFIHGMLPNVRLESADEAEELTWCTGLQSLPKLHVVRGFETLERFAILLKLLGLLRSLESISSRGMRVGAPAISVYSYSEDRALDFPQPSREAGPRGQPCNQWYGFLGCDVGTWM
ncbi:hypothetical protein SLS62_004408 [Diatrype stigma]|uniref:Uncharacterized protein n=1 Tax=Diatrype stigma TaxID=117547 RepID=A0AAN9UWJ0_9PEZI